MKGGLDVNFFSHSAGSIIEKTAEINRKLEQIKKAMESDRPSVSLERFDKWFANFKTSQLVRLFVVEFGLPCLLATFALISIIVRVYTRLSVL